MILVTPRSDAYVGKIVKGYRRKMRRPGEARRQSIVFASRNPQRNGIRRIPILKLRLAVELLNKKSISYEVLFLLCISSQIASGLACYVRKYKLNFRNREMLDKRQHFPFREIEASLSQIWLKLDNSGVSL